MLSAQALIFGLFRISAALQCALCIRLIVTGLAQYYPRFCVYVGALAVESCLINLITSVSVVTRVWTGTRTVLLTLEILAVWEIFNRWKGSYPGSEKFGSKLLVVLFILATGLSVSTFPINWSSTGWTFAVYLMTVANRAVNAGLAAFLLLMLIFFLKFGGPVPPNLRKHTWAMTTFVVANTLTYFVISARVFQLGNILLQVIPIGTLIYWMFALRRSGEDMPFTPANEARWKDAEETRRQILDFANEIKPPKRPVGKK